MASVAKAITVCPMALFVFDLLSRLFCLFHLSIKCRRSKLALTRRRNWRG
jgi:hypothetical protein